MAKFTPIHTNIVIKLSEVEKQTSSGLFIVDSTAEQKIQDGIIISISEDLKDDKDKKLRIKEGDRVIFSQHSGQKIEIEKEVYLVLDYEEIIGIISGAENKKVTSKVKESLEIPLIGVH